MTTIILGCGYVGLELARQLDDEVIGVRRSQEGLRAIEAAGSTGVRADITDADSLEALPPAENVVFAASSGGRSGTAAREIYVEGQRTALEHFANRDQPPDRYLYTSSTGVYGDHDGDWVDETTTVAPTTEKTRVLAEAERVALDEAATRGIDGTVARLAGLYGPERYRLRRYLDGPVTAGYLNMVHRDDAAGAIAHLLTEDRARDEVVLVVDDEPVSKWEFADWLAAACGVDEPPKRTTAERLDDTDLSEAARRRILTSKRCDNAKLVNLGYEFTYPTFRDGYRERIEEFRETDQ